MYKNKILYVVLVLVLTPIVLIFNYKMSSNSIDSHNDSVVDYKNNTNNESKDNSNNGPKGDVITKYLLNNITGKLCCDEIGGTISGRSCVFKDLDGTELEIDYRYLEDYNGKNYCTDEYFDRR
jgi:hypothetical protein